jgi:hypothetical protein
MTVRGNEARKLLQDLVDALDESDSRKRAVLWPAALQAARAYLAEPLPVPREIPREPTTQMLVSGWCGYNRNGDVHSICRDIWQRMHDAATDHQATDSCDPSTHPPATDSAAKDLSRADADADEPERKA